MAEAKVEEQEFIVYNFIMKIPIGWSYTGEMAVYLKYHAGMSITLISERIGLIK